MLDFQFQVSGFELQEILALLNPWLVAAAEGRLRDQQISTWVGHYLK